MAENPLASALNQGAAQVFSTAKTDAAMARMSQRKEREAQEKKKKAEMAANEAKGLYEDLDVTKGWMLRDNEYFTSKYLGITEKWAGKWEELAKDPELMNQYRTEIIGLKKEISDSQASKERWGQLSGLYSDPKWSQFFTEEQKKRFEELSHPDHAGEYIDPDLYTELSTPKENIPNPIDFSKELVPFENHLIGKDGSYVTEGNEQIDYSKTTLDKNKYKDALMVYVNSNSEAGIKLKRGIAEHLGLPSGTEPSENDIIQFVDDVSKQYTAERSSFRKRSLGSGDDQELVFDEGKITEGGELTGKVEGWFNPEEVPGMEREFTYNTQMVKGSPAEVTTDYIDLETGEELKPTDIDAVQYSSPFTTEDGKLMVHVSYKAGGYTGRAVAPLSSVKNSFKRSGYPIETIEGILKAKHSGLDFKQQAEEIPD